MFDSDADIIDYQVAIIEYANGVGMNFHTNLNAPDQFRRFAIFGTRGQAEGDFIRGFFDVTDVLTEARVIHKEYAATELSQHYGADETMAAEVVAHVMRGGPVPVSPLDALEAGILALAMDEARRDAAGGRPAPDLGPLRRRPRREGGLMLKGRATTTLVAWAFLAPALLYVLAIVAWPLVQTVILSLHQRLAAQDHRLGRLGELREDLQPDLRRPSSAGPSSGPSSRSA